MTVVAVLGASGFVGGATCQALTSRGAEVHPIKSPRLRMAPELARTAWQDLPEAVNLLASRLAGSDAVVCCAGRADALSQDVDALFGANAALPGLVAAAAKASGVGRLVHVSSAAVQGATDRLDATSTTHAFSPYSRSKIEGELAVEAAPHPESTVIYRPPGVHGVERRATRTIRRLARSPLASVVGRGDTPTPQAHIDNVAAAIAELALTTDTPPSVVIHPWEGWTTAELMRAFGSGHEPLHIPPALGIVLRRLLRTAARAGMLAPNARRVEMMWFGQRQDESWLTRSGWTPPVRRDGWDRMIEEIDRQVDKQMGSDDD